MTTMNEVDRDGGWVARRYRWWSMGWTGGAAGGGEKRGMSRRGGESTQAG